MQSASPSAKAGLRIDVHVAIFGTALVLALGTAAECSSITHIQSLMYGVVYWGWWACIASAAWSLSQRSPSILSFSPRGTLVHLLFASLLGVAHLFLLWSPLAGARLGLAFIWGHFFNLNPFGMEVLIYGFVMGGVAAIQYRIRAQHDAMNALELQRQLSAAQLRALQMQLEPHFLFNTLNAITTLVELGRQQQAAQMLKHLNAILKSTLARSKPEKVPLAQELEVTENYLAIEQVRFADRLKIEIKVDPSALNALVPCFLLQPIVENAIRHGIAQSEADGMVEASARRDEATLHLRIRDTGAGPNGASENGHGIGLQNTRERLSHFYRDAYAMTAQPLTEGGFEVAISIPYERSA